jgi:hypothetical protein
MLAGPMALAQQPLKGGPLCVPQLMLLADMSHSYPQRGLQSSCLCDKCAAWCLLVCWDLQEAVLLLCAWHAAAQGASSTKQLLQQARRQSANSSSSRLQQCQHGACAVCSTTVGHWPEHCS